MATLVTRIEIIINNRTAVPTFYINSTTQTVPIPNKNNRGKINIGAGNKYLLMMYEYFDQIYGFT